MHQAPEASSKSIKNQHDELHMRPTLRCTSADGEERRDFLVMMVFFFYQHGGILIQQAAEALTPAANRQPDRV